ncbi:hypothetical protein OPV22_024445 [Ensete ventricosum]|uniref:Uncharacterized protein n=1 Tax=Ensete ventricosum TaxID=4639 RepID=A0AAV8QEY0_ENSVE|nr:hypothetical protein OPV22_024445 [Ensete ventricosum]
MAAVLVASVEPFAIASKHPPQVKVLTPSSLGGSFEMAGCRTKRIFFLLCILLLTLVLNEVGKASAKAEDDDGRGREVEEYSIRRLTGSWTQGWRRLYLPPPPAGNTFKAQVVPAPPPPSL